MKKMTVAEIEAAILEHNGNVAAVARAMRVSRGAIRGRIENSARLQTVLEDARETFVDQVESALYGNALDGNVAAQIFIMKAHPVAKARGWSERQEVTGADGQGLRVVIEYEDGPAETPPAV